MDLALLSQTLEELGEPAFRARQIWRWTATGAPSFEAMTDVPKRLRDALHDAVPFSTLTLEHEARGNLHGRLDSGNRAAGGRSEAASPGVVAACCGPGAPVRADAGQRPLPARPGARGVPGLPRAQAPHGVRRVRDARGSE